MAVSENPYAPPNEEVNPRARRGRQRRKRRATSKREFRARRDGDLLVVEPGACLPEMCAKCGARDELGWSRRELVYVPKVSFVFLVAGWLGGVLMLMLRQTGSLEFALCNECERRADIPNFATVGGVVPFLALIVVPILLGWPGLGVLGSYVGVALWILLHHALVVKHGVRPQWIDDTEIHLAGVHPEAITYFVKVSERRKRKGDERRKSEGRT